MKDSDRPLKEEYDLVIMGGGAAAFSAAIRADRMGRGAVIISNGTLGGTCVNVGCVPSKRLLAVSHELFSISHNRFPGVTSDESWALDFKRIIDSKNELVADLRRKKYEAVLDSLERVDFVQGHAALVSPTEVRVNGHRVKGKNTVIATGSSTSVPKVEGLQSIRYLTNVEALSPEKQPSSLIVLGGRALGLEFAQMYQRLGTQVTLLQRSSRILPEEEPEISSYLTQYLREEGADVRTGVALKSVKETRSSKVVEALVDGKLQRFEAEEILLATGRTPNTDGLGLEAVGVELKEDRGVRVDSTMRTTVPNIYAAGDVKGKPMLETVAAREGYIAAENALTNGHLVMDYSAVPHAVFTDPAVASVGLTDAQANASGKIRCACNFVRMDQVPKALILNDTKGLVKLVVDWDTHRILGVHMLASLAPDMIHEGVLAVKHGLTLEDILDTVHVFPTHSEALKLAAQSFFEDVDKLSCCTI